MITIDLFCGAGGMSEGFKLAGFEPVFANDVDEYALQTYKCNHPKVCTSSQPIETLIPSELMLSLGIEKGDIDVLIGGPPCQGFSTYGKRDSNDGRNKLYNYYIDFLRAIEPKFFVMENVVGILSMDKGKVIEEIKTKLLGCGYNFNIITLDASQYGVPQKRKRIFIIGSKDYPQFNEPEATHGNTNTNYTSLFGEELKKYVNVRDAINDLPDYTFTPKELTKNAEYKTDPLNEYQFLMRKDSDKVTLHTAKQMLGIRRLRLALLHPGDYGVDIEKRLQQNGLPEETVNLLMGGKAAIRSYEGCRKQDIDKEKQLRELLSRGNVTLEEISHFIDSQGFANKYRRLKGSSG